MAKNDGNIPNKIKKCYEGVKEDPRMRMTLRVGCFDIDNNHKFDKVIKQIDSCLNTLKDNAVAKRIYTKERPSIRFISKRRFQVSNTLNCKTENLYITNHKTNNQEQVLVYGVEAMIGEDQSIFLDKQIMLHSDLLIIAESESNQDKIKRLIEEHLDQDECPCLVVIRCNQQIDFYSSLSSNDFKNINAQVLGSNIRKNLTEMLLFESLLNPNTKAEKNKKVTEKTLKIIGDYVNEKHIEYVENGEMDFLFTGKIDRKRAKFSLYQFFNKFSDFLARSTNSDGTKVADIAELTEREKTKYPIYKFFKKVLTYFSKSPNRDETKRVNFKYQQESLNCNKLFAQFLRADSLAIHYANVHRSIFLAIYFFGAIALICAVLAISFYECGSFVLAMAIVELLLLVTISKLYKRDHDKRYHMKWLEYRSLAEILRLAPLLNSMGMPQSIAGLEWHCRDSNGSFHSDGKAGRIWLIIYIKMIIRGASFDQIQIDNSRIDHANSFLVKGILTDQINYHKRNVERMKVINNKLSTFGKTLFYLTIILVSVKLIVKSISYFHLYCILDKALISSFSQILGICAAICPILASFGFAVRNHAEFEISSQRSKSMEKDLNQYKKIFTEAKQPVRYKKSAKILKQISIVMQNETVKWMEIYEVKQTEEG